MEKHDAQSLMAGNYLVWNPTENEYFTGPVDHQDILQISELAHYAGYHHKIPLTDEWLLAFGGKIASKEDTYGGILLVLKKGRLIRINKIEVGYCWTLLGLSIPIIHVHEFQNLIFTLTGNFLTLPPNHPLTYPKKQP
jgi:hypothetical protein